MFSMSWLDRYAAPGLEVAVQRTRDRKWFDFAAGDFVAGVPKRLTSPVQEDPVVPGLWVLDYEPTPGNKWLNGNYLVAIGRTRAGVFVAENVMGNVMYLGDDRPVFPLSGTR